MVSEFELIQSRCLATAASDAVQIALHHAQQGRSLAHAALVGSKHFAELQHYPANDVVDVGHGTRFYYHAHRAHEHGHFHLFAEGHSPGDFMHLAGLSLNAQGQPLRWFTTNAWVTGERWHAAAQVLAAIDTFEVQTRGRLASVARWLTAMVRLFQPQLHRLVRRRDAVMQERSRAQDWQVLCEDRRLAVVTQCNARLDLRIQQFQQRGY
jgi:hypothetical protein